MDAPLDTDHNSIGPYCINGDKRERLDNGWRGYVTGYLAVGRIALVVGIVVILFGVFFGIFISEQPEEILSAGELARTTVIANAKFIKGAESWQPVSFGTENSIENIGNYELAFLPHEYDGQTEWGLTVMQFQNGVFLHTYLFTAEKSQLVQNSLCLINPEWEWVEGYWTGWPTPIYIEGHWEPGDTKIYLWIASVNSETKSQGSVPCYHNNTFEIVPKNVGSMTIIATIGQPPLESGGYGFIDIMAGLFTFNVPYVPYPMNVVISGIFYFMLGFLIFALILMLTPFIG